MANWFKKYLAPPPPPQLRSPPPKPLSPSPSPPPPKRSEACQNRIQSSSSSSDSSPAPRRRKRRSKEKNHFLQGSETTELVMRELLRRTAHCRGPTSACCQQPCMLYNPYTPSSCRGYCNPPSLNCCEQICRPNTDLWQTIMDRCNRGSLSSKKMQGDACFEHLIEKKIKDIMCKQGSCTTLTAERLKKEQDKPTVVKLNIDLNDKKKRRKEKHYHRHRQ